MGKDLKGNELGTGLYQRKDGRYEGRYTDRYGKIKSVYNKSLRIVKSERKRLEREERFANTDTVEEDAPTLNEWANIWLDTYKHHVTDSTRSQYKRTYINHIAPALGNKDITKINNVDVVRLMNDIAQTHRIHTVESIRNLLIDILDKALLNDIVKKNVALGVSVSGKPSKEKRVLTPYEQEVFLNACKGHAYENAFIVALHTGLRYGELFALRWSDIDIKGKKLNVTRSLRYRVQRDGRCGYQINKPKTHKSIRTVYFDDICAAALKDQFKKRNQIVKSKIYDPIPGFEDLLFITGRGTPVSTHFADSALLNIINRINANRPKDESPIERIGMHVLRHTYATRCFEAGMSPKIIQEQLGHATLNMTMDLYTHVLDEHKAKEVSKLDQFYA